MKNNLKVLMENFQKVLREEENINNSLALMVASSPGYEIAFVLYNFREILEKGSISLFDGDTDSIVGFMSILPEYNRNKEETGECMNSSVVKGSVVNSLYQGKGFGKMLYGLVMIHLYPDPLMPDRGSVSKSARGLWKSLEKNPKVKKGPPNKKPFIGKFDDIMEPSTEPKKDDCIVHYGPDTKGSQFLDKAYSYGGNKQLLNLLLKKHDAVEKKINNKNFKKLLIDAGELLFRKEYSHDED